MASVTLNPVFTGISGRMGGLVHVRRYGKQHVRIRVIPRNPQTEAQMENRMNFKEAVLTWQSLSAEKKDPYRMKAKKKQMSGYNLFISQYMKRIPHVVLKDAVTDPNAQLSLYQNNSTVTAPFPKGGREDSSSSRSLTGISASN